MYYTRVNSKQKATATITRFLFVVGPDQTLVSDGEGGSTNCHSSDFREGELARVEAADDFRRGG